MNEPDKNGLQSFMQEMGDVQPLSGDDKVYHHSPSDSLAQKLKRASAQATHSKHLNPLSMEGVKPLRPDDYLSHQQPGIQDGVFKNLRQGKYTLELRLSLKGMTLEQSREAVYQSIISGHERGMRAILIQHGRGEQSKPFPALKKSYLAHWLLELEEVIAFHTAQPQHGGLGATYVLLKKHPQQKQINRELNRRR
ncbi:DNA endonuclease SmrA [Alteromonas aestuariivivens]|uniref:DNA endonuclease SmrA n=1 Tax=Alteromonas aestuariivivens TaxID=1938339 RepID=A0A3D8M4B6_9ALTE|nr:DNA endonuclease SmrA [Alteromonas aestuariivivens]RDV24420.1 DNA endonuclease SmrA [Alteromonas aestuariivivens]